MVKIRRRIVIEAVILGVILVVLVGSYVSSGESAIGRSPLEILRLAIEKNDYRVAQRVYETENVLGAQDGALDIETLIYPEKKIAAEIARVQELLVMYPTYPPLLRQLVDLNRLTGNEDASKEYERELERLNIAY